MYFNVTNENLNNLKKKLKCSEKGYIRYACYGWTVAHVNIEKKTEIKCAINTKNRQKIHTKDMMTLSTNGANVDPAKYLFHLITLSISRAVQLTIFQNTTRKKSPQN